MVVVGRAEESVPEPPDAATAAAEIQRLAAEIVQDRADIIPARRAIIQLSNYLPHPLAVEVLIEIIKTTAQDRREDAIEALSAVENEQLFGILMDIMYSKEVHNSITHYKKPIIALGKIGDMRATFAITSFLSDTYSPKLRGTFDGGSLTSMITSALIVLKDPFAIPQLEEAADAFSSDGNHNFLYEATPFKGYTYPEHWGQFVDVLSALAACGITNYSLAIFEKQSIFTKRKLCESKNPKVVGAIQTIYERVKDKSINIYKPEELKEMAAMARKAFNERRCNHPIKQNSHCTVRAFIQRAVAV